MSDNPALRVARQMAHELAEQGAEAVILVGSHARGDAHAESDIDLHAIGEGPPYALSRAGDQLVSISWRSADQHRQAFGSPQHAGQVIPAWRGAVILYDPQGIAAELQQEARAWSWEAIAAECDVLVAAGVTGCAEETHKLAISLERRHRTTAAIQRDVLTIALAQVMAIHKRLLYDTENRLWDVVAGALGERWAGCQSAALGLMDKGFEGSCRAALELYSLAAAEVWPLLSADQRAVVSHACALAGFPFSLTTPKSK